MKLLTVNKCCCWFDLKYGFLTWAIISLVFRLTTIVMLFYSDYLPIQQPEARVYLKSITPLMGYFIACTIALFIAVKGVVQEKSILIYPYIVILVCELTVGLSLHAILAIVVSWIYFVTFLVAGAAGIYVLLCLISLYKQIKRSEENNVKSKSNGANLA
ncbi:hypothetical protein ILUMI_27150 [Ignelater luminosus]|uniref:Uncharacterized protein n=1 Tax=Ignelater luminosus TaxID=2038154 RepID=A0A8K0C3A8_IGNLU|nr:hypothetical protein ILUMI_27150 [Ignelater luminosus]